MLNECEIKWIKGISKADVREAAMKRWELNRSRKPSLITRNCYQSSHKCKKQAVYSSGIKRKIRSEFTWNVAISFISAPLRNLAWIILNLAPSSNPKCSIIYGRLSVSRSGYRKSSLSGMKSCDLECVYQEIWVHRIFSEIRTQTQILQLGNAL